MVVTFFIITTIIVIICLQYDQVCVGPEKIDCRNSKQSVFDRHHNDTYT